MLVSTGDQAAESVLSCGFGAHPTAEPGKGRPGPVTFLVYYSISAFFCAKVL